MKNMAIATRLPCAAALGAAILIGTGLLALPAQAAGFVMTFEQVGGNVVESGSGTLDLTDLTPYGTAGLATADLWPAIGYINTGVTGAIVDVYKGLTGPTGFGSGSGALASSSSGDAIGIAGSNSPYGLLLLWVPSGYVSDNPLTDTATYAGASFASLGMTPGTYVWTWGSGADTGSFTVDVRADAVPEPTGLMLLALPIGLLGLLATRRRPA
jgi:hypothetical protein